MKYKEVKQHTAAVCVCVHAGQWGGERCVTVTKPVWRSWAFTPRCHRTAIYSIKLISTPVFLTKDKYKTRIQIYPRTTTNMTSGPEQF